VPQCAKRAFVAILKRYGTENTGAPWFSEDGKTAISTSRSGVFRVWDMPKLDP
jgi:hypothetical protein